MLKDRLFLLGLGVGLIAGTLLLQLMLAADVQQDRTEQMAAQIVGSASENNSTLDSEQAKDDEQAQLLEQAQKELETLRQEQEQLLKEQEERVKAALAEQLEQQAEQTGVRAVSVKKGMGVNAIAELLQDAALIDDAEAFLKEARLDRNRIRNGKYYFTGTPDAEQIKQILLADPLQSKPKQLQ